MSTHFEDFVNEHREAFDDEAPAPEVWDRIRERMPQTGASKPAGPQAPVRSLPLKRWLSAAAAVVLVAAGWMYFGQHKTTQPLAETPVKQPVRTMTLPPAEPSDSRQIPDSAQTIAAGPKKAPEKTAGPSSQEEADYNEEMYHYARLVEIKHSELKTLQKDEPLLYRQFSGDVNKLDSVYQTLKTQLPQNPNREQVIEAMISNLQLQIGLLNKQLDIIKQIKHSKKAAYEKAYRSV